jgi:hypothetical protein
MISTLFRRSYFLQSPFADSFIAQMQQSYAADLDQSDRRDKKVLRERFDHREALVQPETVVDGHAVIALPAATKALYTQRVPQQLKAMLTMLETTRLTLLDFVNTDLSEFPFENFSKRNRFRQLTARIKNDHVVQFDVEEIGRMLPLFLFSGCYDLPVIFIIADGPVPLSLRLCDDGNFHLNFRNADRSRVIQAAELAEFVTGGTELCDTYSVASLR